MAQQGRRWLVTLAAALTAAAPGAAWAQTPAPASAVESSKDLEVGYIGWVSEHSTRHQAMAALVFRRQSPIALVVRATGSSAPVNEHDTSPIGSYSREGSESLFGLSGGARYEGRLPRATMFLQALVGGALHKRNTKTTIDDKYGWRESHHDSSSVNLLADISGGIQVRVTDRVGVFGTVGITGPPQYLASYRMPSVTTGVSITLPSRRSPR